MSKQRGDYVKEIAKVGIILGLVVGGVLGLNFVLQASLGTSYPTVVVTSGSMEPSLHRGDICILQGVPPEQVIVGNHLARNGDIIVFDATGIYYGTEPVIHRVIDRTYNITTSHYWFLTQGDNNPVPDPKWVEDSKVYGKVIGTIPWIGNLLLFLREGGVWLIIPVLAVIIVWMIVGEASKVQKKAKEKVESKSS